MPHDFGNEQDMSVHDKFNPSLGPTEEAQDVASLNRIVVPMPAFTDPHNPMAQSGSVNLPLDRHPVTHSEDYARDVQPGTHTYQADDGEASTMAAGAVTLSELSGVSDKFAALSEDREEWKKADWQVAATHYGLPTSGNFDTIRARVEDYETDQEAVEEREKELHSLSRDELDNLAGSYDIDPEDYSRKEDLASAILAAEQKS